MNECDLATLFEKRRSIYNQEKLPQTKAKAVADIVSHALKYCPTAFNSQSGRIVILYGADYQRFWEMVRQKLIPLTPQDKMSAMEEKNRFFAAGSGTILFFEDQDTVAGLQEKFPLYRDNFPVWSLEANGMLQYMVWLALAEHEIGASLQHYNPLIDQDVQKIWNIPTSWKLLAQMPFGRIAQPAQEKSFLPVDERIRIFG